MKGKTVVMIGMVAFGHCAAIAIALSFSGCGMTRRPAGRPPPPIMPPPAAIDAHVESPARPPLLAEPAAPAMMAEDEGAAEPTTSYVVQAGDTLSQIARRHGVAMSDLIRINELQNPDVLQVGQTLALPGDVRVKPGASSTSETEAAAGLGAGTTYTVESGDCLSKIAARFGTTVDGIKQANGMSSDRIVVGQTLRVPGARSDGEEDDAMGLGESTFATDGAVGELEVFGDGPLPEAPAAFTSDQDVTVPPDEPELAPPPGEAPEMAPPVAPQGEPRWHTASPGEDLETIAEMYPGVRADDIMRLNGMKSPTVVPGQRLQIPPAGE